MTATKGSNALIQQLLKAEEEAEAIVKRAKENRVKLLNEAISAAEKDLKQFSDSEEKRLMEEFQKESASEDPHLDDLEKKTKEHIKEIDERVKLYKDKLVNKLVAATVDVEVSIPDSFRQSAVQEPMKDSESLSKLLDIDPQSFVEDLSWFLDGVEEPRSLADLDPSSNPKSRHFFENGTRKHRQDSIDTSPGNEVAKVLDETSLDTPLLAHMNAMLKRVADARESWQDEMMDTFLDHEEEICEFATDLNYCDSTLRLVEEALMKHYKKLEVASTSITNLYSESEELSMSLENRKRLLKALKDFLDDVTISPTMIKAICREPLDENYLKLLGQFKDKAEKIKNGYVNAQYPALNPSKIQVKKLELVIVRRIYDFMRMEIAKLATPKANLQMIQSTHFLRLQPLYAYIRDTNTLYSGEIKNQYSKTLRKIYHHLFSNYYASLERFRIKNRYREIGVVMKRSSQSPEGYFALQDRDTLVKTFKDAPMVPTGMQPESIRTEDIMKSFLKLLVDTASSEYMFINNFFEKGSTELLLYIFEETLGHLRLRIESLAKSSYNVVMLTAIMLLLGANRRVLLERGISILDEHLARMQTHLYHSTMVHMKNLVEHVKQQTQLAAASTIESWLPGGFAINLSNAVHALHRLKEIPAELGLQPFKFEVLDESLKTIHATLCLQRDKVNNPAKADILMIANCAPFFQHSYQTNTNVTTLKDTLDCHLDSYVKGYIHNHFKEFLETVGGMNDSTASGTITDDVITSWRNCADDFVTNLPVKLEAIKGRVMLHFVHAYTIELVLTRIVEAVEQPYAILHGSLERIIRPEDAAWLGKIPVPGALRQAALPNLADQHQ